MQSKRYVMRRCDKGSMDDNTVYVGQICDIALHVFGENPKGFLAQNKDPSLWKRESKCYNFKQLKQLLTVAFHKEVAFRVKV